MLARWRERTQQRRRNQPQDPIAAALLQAVRGRP